MQRHTHRFVGHVERYPGAEEAEEDRDRVGEGRTRTERVQCL